MLRPSSRFESTLASLYSESIQDIINKMHSYKKPVSPKDLSRYFSNKMRYPSNLKIKLDSMKKDGILDNKREDLYSLNGISKTIFKYSKDSMINKLKREGRRDSSCLKEKILLLALTKKPKSLKDIYPHFPFSERLVNRDFYRLKSLGFFRKSSENARYFMIETEVNVRSLNKSERYVYSAIKGSHSDMVRMKDVAKKVNTMFTCERGIKSLLKKDIISESFTRTSYGLTRDGKVVAVKIMKIKNMVDRGS